MSEKLKTLRQKRNNLKQRIKQRKNKPNLPVDKVEFFETVLKLKLYPYQAEFESDPAPLKVLRWPRRAGKTTIMSGDDLHCAMHNPNSKIIVTMPKYQQIKEIYFQAFHEHLARMDRDIYGAYIDSELQTIIRFTNGSIILAETPEPFTIRGHGPRKISIDEMNFIRKDEDLWLSALLPMTLTQTVSINVASTPWNKDSIYYKMCYDKGFRIFSGNIHERDPPRYFLTWKEVQKPNGPLDPYQVEVMREQYAGDPWRWKREMESSFVDDETAFLPSSLIIKCQNDQLEFADFEDLLTGEFYIGWDLGRERDHNAVAIIEKQVDFVRLVHCKQFPLGTPYVSVMAYIKSICDRWRHIRAVYYDHTGTKGMDEQIDDRSIEAEITKGKYHDYDTFLGQEASEYLRAYLETRRQGTEKIPPENIHDETPLLRNQQCKRVLPLTPAAIHQLVHDLYVKAALVPAKAFGRRYDLRAHSIRKFFRTQMAALGVQTDYIEYMMGHTISTYHDIKMKGIEFLRNIYTASGLSIRPKTRTSKIDALKEIIRAWGLNPEEILTKQAFAEPHITVVDHSHLEENQIHVLSNALKQQILKELREDQHEEKSIIKL